MKNFISFCFFRVFCFLFEADYAVLVSWYWMLGVGVVFWGLVFWLTGFRRWCSPGLNDGVVLKEKEVENDDLLLESKRAEQALLLNDTIAASHIDQTFDQQNLILDDVSFSVQRNELCVFLGPNGAGKTTAIKILTGELNPSAGKTIIGGDENVTPGSP